MRRQLADARPKLSAVEQAHLRSANLLLRGVK